jgi:hypothetical protein
VRHVREELGLVFRSERELLGLAFQRHAGLLHFRVLALHLLVLGGELGGLFLEFLVGLLQFFLAVLELAGERLRLLQEILRQRVRLDGVEHDTD